MYSPGTLTERSRAAQLRKGQLLVGSNALRFASGLVGVGSGMVGVGVRFGIRRDLGFLYSDMNPRLGSPLKH